MCTKSLAQSRDLFSRLACEPRQSAQPPQAPGHGEQARRLNLHSRYRANLPSGTFSPVTRLPLPLRLVLLSGFLLRLAWSLTRASDPATIEQLPDQREYLQLSNN